MFSTPTSLSITHANWTKGLSENKPQAVVPNFEESPVNKEMEAAWKT